MLYSVTTNRGTSYIARGTDLTVLELGGRVLLWMLRESGASHD